MAKREARKRKVTRRKAVRRRAVKRKPISHKLVSVFRHEAVREALSAIFISSGESRPLTKIRSPFSNVGSMLPEATAIMGESVRKMRNMAPWMPK